MARARSEAKSAFGDDRVFIEKFIVEPRHIEIQVLGDKHGNVINLGERECSIQRRNQKVIEEAPCPLLDAPTRERMGREAVALARAVNYDFAGTVEFVAAQDRSFYFLEMNTRLQVEHAVTELVTGIDIVEQMIRVAAGEKLALTQADVALNGSAVECRIYAEDPARNFLPSTGRLIKYRPPPERSAGASTLRIDTGVEEGGEISIYYDPMIAKLVTHAPTREAAIAAQARALDGFYIDGIRHNIAFLAALMQNPRWQAGELSTAFIAEEFPDGFAPRVPEGSVAQRIAAVAAAVDHVLAGRRRRISGQLSGRLPERAPLRLVRFEGTEFRVAVETGDGVVRVTFVDITAPVTLSLASPWKPGDPVWNGTIDGEPVSVQVRRILNGFQLSHGGAEAKTYVLREQEAAAARLMPVKAPADLGNKLLCPMPGLVLSVPVIPGQEVKAGEPLAVIEAMKMENVLRAPADGTVKTVYAKKGDSLALDDVILDFV